MRQGRSRRSETNLIARLWRNVLALTHRGDNRINRVHDNVGLVDRNKVAARRRNELLAVRREREQSALQRDIVWYAQSGADDGERFVGQRPNASLIDRIDRGHAFVEPQALRARRF
jgi:hypothetical protein